MDLKKLKGVRDYSHEEALILEKIHDTGKTIFKKYGYLPLDTTALERWEVLTAKDVNAGEEIKEQTYNFKDRGGKHIGLRFDLTVSLIRYVAEHQNINIPFKRYQLGKVYRYEEAKRSRYREFYQMDIDVVGGKSIAYDAEILAIAHELFNSLGLKNHIFLINNRKLVEQIIRDKYKHMEVLKAMRVIDKIDKISKDEFLKEGFNEEDYELFKKEFNSYESLINATGYECKDLQDLEHYLKSMNVKNYKFSLKIVRGLGYYTGNVFETFIKGYESIGSVGSGGRYDKVFERIIKRPLPSVGYGFGVDRILDVMLRERLVEKLDLIYIAYTPSNMLNQAIAIRKKLAENNIYTYINYDYKSLTNQIKEAVKRGIRWLIIVGKKDIEENKITLRDLEKGIEEKLEVKDVLSRFRSRR